MTLFPSAMSRSPSSRTQALGFVSRADVAGPPSPEYPEVPVPATVVMIPAGVTSRTTLL